MNGYKVLKTTECFLPACCDITRAATNKIWDGIIFDNQPGHNCISCWNLPLNNRNKKIWSKQILKATCYKSNLKNIFAEGWPQHDSMQCNIWNILISIYIHKQRIFLALWFWQQCFKDISISPKLYWQI